MNGRSGFRHSDPEESKGKNLDEITFYNTPGQLSHMDPDSILTCSRIFFAVEHDTPMKYCEVYGYDHRDIVQESGTGL
jgi:hypothetical protein